MTAETSQAIADLKARADALMLRTLPAGSTASVDDDGVVCVRAPDGTPRMLCSATVWDSLAKVYARCVEDAAWEAAASPRQAVVPNRKARRMTKAAQRRSVTS